MGIALGIDQDHGIAAADGLIGPDLEGDALAEAGGADDGLVHLPPLRHGHMDGRAVLGQAQEDLAVAVVIGRAVGCRPMPGQGIADVGGGLGRLADAQGPQGAGEAGQEMALDRDAQQQAEGEGGGQEGPPGPGPIAVEGDGEIAAQAQPGEQADAQGKDEQGAEQDQEGAEAPLCLERPVQPRAIGPDGHRIDPQICRCHPGRDP